MTMTRNKDFKRLVRARMRKTGEAYTAARAQVTKKLAAKPAAADIAPVAPSVAPTPKDYPKLAGMSDASIKAKTGCAWEKWVRALDHRGAENMSHREIAQLVHDKYKIDGWWSQNVAVGYERIKGLRARGQQRDGSYGATKSRTFSVPVSVLFDAWTDPSLRRRWLTDATTRVRKATTNKSLRLDWSDGGTKAIIAVGFTAKGASKSTVALEHAKLPDREAATHVKQYWTDRLAALNALLAKS
jgi:uncharacterized protein YndB with AHSA1/START domain